MTVDTNKQTAMAFFQALGRSDRSALLELCDDALEWTVPQGAVLHAGTHTPASAVFDLMLSAVSDTFVAGSQRTNFDLIIATLALAALSSFFALPLLALPIVTVLVFEKNNKTIKI